MEGNVEAVMSAAEEPKRWTFNVIYGATWNLCWNNFLVILVIFSLYFCNCCLLNFVRFLLVCWEWPHLVFHEPICGDSSKGKKKVFLYLDVTNLSFLFLSSSDWWHQQRNKKKEQWHLMTWCWEIEREERNTKLVKFKVFVLNISLT